MFRTVLLTINWGSLILFYLLFVGMFWFPWLSGVGLCVGLFIYLPSEMIRKFRRIPEIGHKEYLW